MGDPNRLVVGASAPCYFEMTVLSGGTLDLSGVTAASFRVRYDDGSEAEWPATVTERAADSVRVRHVFAPADLPRRGLLTLFAVLTLPAGQVQSAARQERVYGPWDV